MTTPNSYRQSLRDSVVAVRRHRPDYLIILFMGILAALGLIVLYAISAARVELINANGGGSLGQGHFIEKQSLSLLLGSVAFMIFYFTPVQWLHRMRERLWWLAVGACLLLSILGLFHTDLVLCANGSCRWYNFGSLSVQPAELLKFALLLFLAGFLAQRLRQGKINDVRETLVPVGILLAISLVLVVGFQKDMGTGLSLLGIVAAILFVAQIKLKYFMIGLGAMLVATVFFIMIAPHRIDRITTFLSSGSGSATSYHITQAEIAIGSGGVFGKSLANSVQAYGYLPEAVNDSIFAILGEMFGLVGLIAIMAVFFALLLRLLKTIDNVVDPFMKLLVAGVFGWVATQTIVNIGAMLGVFPLTGVTLPFLSFGGTSLLFIMAALGIAMQVSQYTSHNAKEKTTDENPDLRRRLGRTRHARAGRYQRA